MLYPTLYPQLRQCQSGFKRVKPTIEGADKADAGTIKRCIPVLDAVSQGYIIPLWADLQVKVMKQYDFLDADGKVVHTEATDKPDEFLGKETTVTKETMANHKETGELGIWMRFPEIDLKIGNLIGQHGWQTGR